MFPAKLGHIQMYRQMYRPMTYLEGLLPAHL